VSSARVTPRDKHAKCRLDRGHRLGQSRRHVQNGGPKTSYNRRSVWDASRRCLLNHARYINGTEEMERGTEVRDETIFNRRLIFVIFLF